ncbi:MAG: hypothetical protein JNK95_01710 [Candidatus Competibacter sp.]|nr:hypothetical protein [Candidatus Competibacter sp.]MDG4604710.1 hypothetical protein [Candidatus Contendobacter sp.]HRD48020.1 hypothetical protein [Candidatus Contendobacter sp.]
MIDSISSGVSVIQAGMSRLEQSAQTIARQSITNPASPASTAGDLIQPLIEQQQALYQVQAGVKVIQTNNNLLGSLFDMFA